ncbi:hypothetical protein DCC81_03570 [Chitinophaga parva]|uniref:DNA primase/polymerase bifunctional N-terminal domain-containing protein n=1 Tax=Chitinophaga parva TaxID=2169414 RepID=A0A2T7BLM0_9BACT|nr:bifunctional DNA primase/polymerase [Chitinophaga parva]PUZ28572.1 hypothetical protein DCC81_03570 [Chitinophaga parva]
MKTLFQYGLAYLEMGFAPVTVGSKKRPAEDWKNYQTRAPTPAELYQLCQLPWATGLALVCGPGSGGLEVIDMDLKYDLSGRLREDFEAAIRKADPALLDSLVINSTRSGGRHYLYRCQTIGRNTPLAQRPATQQELAIKPKALARVLIETRGVKGVVLVPPSPGYQTIAGDFTVVPEITAAQRELLFSIARSFNQVKEKKQKPYKPRTIETTPVEGISSMDDFDKRGDPVALLVKHGWKVVGEPGEITQLLRPGDTDKDTSGNYNATLRWFSTFSNSAAPFEAETGYKPSAVFAELECGGDYTKAARELGRLGYGDPRRRKPPKKVIAWQRPGHRM